MGINFFFGGGGRGGGLANGEGRRDGRAEDSSRQNVTIKSILGLHRNRNINKCDAFFVVVFFSFFFCCVCFSGLVVVTRA